MTCMAVVARVLGALAVSMLALAYVLPLVGAGPAAAWAAGGGLVAFIGFVASTIRQFPPPEE